jgi:small subunit ribosomal protein S14
MTTSNYKKVLKQLKVKPPKLGKFLKHNSPKARTCGIAKKPCIRCGRYGGHVSKYGLDLCRCCFRDIATRLGFKKFN